MLNRELTSLKQSLIVNDSSVLLVMWTGAELFVFKYNSWELTALLMERAACFWQSFPAFLFVFFFQMLLLMETGGAGPAGPRVQEVRGPEGDSATTLPHRMVAPRAQGQTLRQFLARENQQELAQNWWALGRLLGKTSPHWISESASLCPWVSSKSETFQKTVGAGRVLGTTPLDVQLSHGIECAYWPQYFAFSLSLLQWAKWDKLYLCLHLVAAWFQIVLSCCWRFLWDKKRHFDLTCSRMCTNAQLLWRQLCHVEQNTAH